MDEYFLENMEDLREYLFGNGARGVEENIKKRSNLVKKGPKRSKKEGKSTEQTFYTKQTIVNIVVALLVID